jgi:uncharacterized protein (TIGR02284 family)
MNKERIVDTLNALLQTSRDGAMGFRTCARDVKSPTLAPLFEASAKRCEEGAAQLEVVIRKLGGQPAASGSVIGIFHRTWTDILSSLSGMEERVVLEECERGESVALRAYEAALAEDLPLDVEQLVRRQYAGVKENLFRIHGLRDLTAKAS